ncbi:GDSL-type esterase/lipase family protein [Mucilaginibacter myungsuensis]|uniref:Sialate O-acetylesterase n=1 Tax=Mucilaginibacter myungsuensis TaxID=649104 RepID=A0A929KTZ9_9SPHI|nr:GDSL-type esterase/lipase family protein [Mucilaginibacter myungsuensis]MBE9661541.1 sialate O-acetylesterase [Mucilaginibacter myungsuensis]MDN3597684.1 GDSL-type esterase/lipase family protein [Mucilaginibacter myungsuensis]
MKNTFLTLTCLLALSANSFAQTTPAAKPPAIYPKGVWDSTYRPKITADSLASFKAHPVTSTDVVFLGNSITARGKWATLLNEPHARNRGISADITFGILDRLDDVIAGKPKKVFILIGINDISRNIPDSLIIRNHKRMVDRIRKGSPNTQIYFNTILPVNASFGKFPNHYGKDEHILAINEAIKKLKGKNVTIIDLYPHFLDGEGHLKAEWTDDGLHPNAAGYQPWVKIFADGGYLK